MRFSFSCLLEFAHTNCLKQKRTHSPLHQEKKTREGDPLYGLKTEATPLKISQTACDFILFDIKYKIQRLNFSNLTE